MGGKEGTGDFGGGKRCKEGTGDFGCKEGTKEGTGDFEGEIRNFVEFDAYISWDMVGLAK